MLPFRGRAHLSGAISGLLLAVIFRKQGPQKPTDKWDETEEDMEEYLAEHEKDDDHIPQGP